MSKAQNPMTGQMSGSMANFVTTRCGKQNIIRSKAFEPRDANSEAQQMQRSGFKMVVDVYTLLGSIPEEGFVQRAESTSAYIAFMAANMSKAIDKSGDTPIIDYSKLTVADGSMASLMTKSAILDKSGITLTYLPSLRNLKNAATDEVVALALLKSGEVWIESQVRGADAISTLLIPVKDINVEDVAAFYAFTKNADGSKSSKSVYVTLSI